ncbi:MAG: TetR/AcrR family transcriptional regulator [Clostridiales bacterium]|nr:TetR/AcrR family transcriptional regulator [Clostridiales bacterium]
MEHIQASLLDDCLQAYQTVQEQPAAVCSPEHFEERFDCTPPKSLWIWFEYCKRQRRAITVLLDPEHGDVYFKTKLKAVLLKYINRMMDNDGMPHDALREHFVRIFLELHFLAAQTWLTAGEDDFLSVQEIINLLNTMRVGANYLNYRRLTTPDFDPEMGLREDPENEPARHIRP